MATAYILTGAVLLLLTGYTMLQREGWAQRNITPIFGWAPVLTAQSVAALASVTFTGPTWGTSAAVAGAAFVWLGLLAVATDLKTRKVPWDIAHPVAAVGLIAFATNYTFEGLLAFGSCLIGVVAVPLLARALTNKGLGMSDIRLLWAATATCSWWAGQTWLLYALIIASIVQLLVRALARPLNLGAMVPVHPDRDTPAGEPVPMRREIAFAPALIFALFLTVGYATYTGYGSCAMWNIVGTCGPAI